MKYNFVIIKRALEKCIEGNSTLTSNNSYDINLMDLMPLLDDTIKNRNRFVRETTFHLIKSIVSSSQIKTNNQDINVKLCKYLSCGLSDNWSQVS